MTLSDRRAATAPNFSYAETSVASMLRHCASTGTVFIWVMNSTSSTVARRRTGSSRAMTRRPSRIISGITCTQAATA